MPTILQLHEWCKDRMSRGEGDLHTNHVVIVEREAARRAKNEPDEEGKRKTRIAWDAHDPDTFAEFHKERERYMKAAGSNPILATDAMICALRLHDSDEIRRFVEAIQHATEEAGGKW